MSFIDIKPISKLYLEQAQIVSKIKSILTYAEIEGFQTRAILVGIEKDKEISIKPFNRELKEYSALVDSENQGLQISKAFGKEIIYNLDKIIKRLHTDN